MFLLPYHLNTFALTDVERCHEWINVVDAHQIAEITSFSITDGLYFDITLAEARLEQRNSCKEQWDEISRVQQMFPDILTRLNGLKQIVEKIYLAFTIADRDRVLNDDPSLDHDSWSFELNHASYRGNGMRRWLKNFVDGRDIEIVQENIYKEEDENDYLQDM